MARLFNNAALDGLLSTTTPLGSSAIALSMAGWCYPDEALGPQFLMASADVASATAFHGLALSSTHQVQATTRTTGSASSSTTTGTGTINTWFHAGGVWGPTDASRVAYLNGVAATANTTSLTPLSQDNIAIGYRNNSTATGHFSGRLAELGLWNVALTADELLALSRGRSPLRVRPLSLVGYWPIWGIHSPEIDLTSGLRSMTVTGTVRADHAPVPPFSRRYWGTMPLAEVAAATKAPPPFHRSARWSAWR